VWVSFLYRLSDAVTNSQSSISLRDLGRRVFEPRLCYVDTNSSVLLLFFFFFAETETPLLVQVAPKIPMEISQIWYHFFPICSQHISCSCLHTALECSMSLKSFSHNKICDPTGSDGRLLELKAWPCLNVTNVYRRKMKTAYVIGIGYFSSRASFLCS
jgi:hypothetical protein